MPHANPPIPLISLQTDPWFASCAPELQAALLMLGRTRRLGAGERLFVRGDNADGLCCVTSGALRVGALQPDGSESLLAYVEPFQWFGEISLIDNLPRTHDAVADGETTLILVPQDALLAWLSEHPLHWRDMARLACAKLRMAFTVLEDIAHLPLEQRLAKQLWQVAHGYGARADAPQRQIRLPQEQLALMLGVSRQTANKALRALQEQGVLRLHYGAIELVDVAALARAAGLA
ncbi:MAG TPA: Crp/Fnr family transcriptional regulator [Rhizobacter sp.]|nr:Crp/Fnr family transcriptional regulator [Rhizobacter sp.]